MKSIRITFSSKVISHFYQPNINFLNLCFMFRPYLNNFKVVKLKISCKCLTHDSRHWQTKSKQGIISEKLCGQNIHKIARYQQLTPTERHLIFFLMLIML